MINFNKFDIEEKQTLSDKELSDFLHYHNAYDNYIKNVIEYGRDVKYFIEHTGKSSYISAAFTWESTPQGHDYWSDINKIWIDYLSNYSSMSDIR